MLKVERKPSFDTDVLMQGVFKWLVRDLRTNLSSFDFYATEEALFDKGVASYRNREVKTYFLSPYYYFKARYQMDNLFKRYRFASDVYTNAELEKITCDKFLSTQVRIASKKKLSFRAFSVLHEARLIIKEILGDFDEKEHHERCKFGKRASVGCPASMSYLDVRLAGPITGSADHIGWFSDHLKEDKILREAIQMCSDSEPSFALCNELTLTNVPKSYKSLRSIMPNTTIGSFYTYGLGKMIEKRLSKVGLHIPSLQERHKGYVKRYSRTRSHVTADLSAASDSFTVELINRLLPRPWFNKINFGRIKRVKIKKKTYHLESFMTMGIGFTFQLQTLCFYALLKGIEKLSGCKGKISVYGDDLIYPKRMHNYVKSIFEDLGFILNSDKTFVFEEFRESCGSDCYCGIDVRPFQPEGSHQLLSSRLYNSLLYKTINGLLLRWSEEEIPGTLEFLYSEVLRVSPQILQVPPSFPDYSGVKVHEPKMDNNSFWSKISYNENLSIRFDFLKAHPRDRFVLKQIAYYWDTLRSSDDESVDSVDTTISGEYLDRFFRIWDILPNDIAQKRYDDTSESRSMRWIRDERRPYPIRSKLTGQRYRKLRAVVAEKQARESFIRQTGSVPAWT